MDLRTEYLLTRLDACCEDALANELDYRVWTEFHLPAMIFLVKEDWDIIGGPLTPIIEVPQIADFLISQMHNLQIGKLQPYVMAVCTGFFFGLDIEEENPESQYGSPAKLYLIVSDESRYGLIQFANGQTLPFQDHMDYETVQALDSVLDKVKELWCQ